MAETHDAAPAAKLGISMLDPEIQECPYDAYALLRDQALHIPSPVGPVREHLERAGFEVEVGVVDYEFQKAENHAGSRMMQTAIERGTEEMLAAMESEAGLAAEIQNVALANVGAQVRRISAFTRWRRRLSWPFCRASHLGG